MKISERKEFATKTPPLVCDPGDLVVDAVKRMSEKNFGSIIAVDAAHKPIGMMTERDIFRRLIAEGRDPAKTSVGDIMTTQLRLANADDDMLDWLRLMSNERFRRLPVVDEQGKLIAVMSQGDFVSYTWPQLLSQLTQMTRATALSGGGLTYIAVGILAYTIILVAVLALFG
ncbi:cyclic nucleotide-binding/CBS domain-containing protein [Pontixanthobacter sp.]|uniref:CBS domain-containing protein n=1 Tax=Pontixanthobacter sp. TaxID=2792078 RepID=UPI003C7D5D55